MNKNHHETQKPSTVKGVLGSFYVQTFLLNPLDAPTTTTTTTTTTSIPNENNSWFSSPFSTISTSEEDFESKLSPEEYQQYRQYLIEQQKKEQEEFEEQQRRYREMYISFEQESKKIQEELNRYMFINYASEKCYRQCMPRNYFWRATSLFPGKSSNECDSLNAGLYQNEKQCIQSCIKKSMAHYDYVSPQLDNLQKKYLAKYI